MDRDAFLYDLKRRITDGSYRVDPAAVAEAMLSHVPSKHASLERADRRSQIIALAFLGERHVDIAEMFGTNVSNVTKTVNRHQRPAVHVRR